MLSGLSIAALFFGTVAILCLVEFRKKVRLIRSLSNKREFDVYVPYNMLIFGVGQFHFRWPPTELAYPHDVENEAVVLEIKRSWIISGSLILTSWLTIGTAVFSFLSYTRN